MFAHHSTAAVVVQVHQRPSVFHHVFPSVHEGLGKLDAVVDVVAASAPVERAPGVGVSAALVAVTVADLKLPLAAGPGDGVDHPGRGDGVDERRLSAAWVQRKMETSCRVISPLENGNVLTLATALLLSYSTIQRREQRRWMV